MYISKSITVQFTQYAVISGKVTFLVILHAYKKPGKIFLSVEIPQFKHPLFHNMP